MKDRRATTDDRRPRADSPLTSTQIAALHDPLLAWYDRNKRDLPWRRRQGDPYAVWVSEIMLQQTQVATVIPYYERWMARFPTIGALASSSLDDVLHAWSGLGYYARARNLHRAAQLIVNVHASHFPRDTNAIRSLPGIGRYSAGAIRSIAFNERASVLDGNVIRVLSRVFAIDGNPKSTSNQVRLWELAEALIPDGAAREFNQALMELGALVCRPSDPGCGQCPLLSICRAGNSPDPTVWPQLPPGKRTVRVNHAALVIRNGDRTLVVQRRPHGLWGGLWEFPRGECYPGEPPRECVVRVGMKLLGVEVEIGDCIARVKHTVTHHSITLHGFSARITAGIPTARDCLGFGWVTKFELESLPLSSPQRTLAELVFQVAIS